MKRYLIWMLAALFALLPAAGLAADLLLGGGLGALGLPGLAGGQHDVVLRAGAGLLGGGTAWCGGAVRYRAGSVVGRGGVDDVG